jgi:predicted lipid-binding transport protein (Tim44 family)
MSLTSLQGLGDFPVALVIFGAIALFLVLRLRSILGRRVGLEKPPGPAGMRSRTGPIIEGTAAPFSTGHQVPDPQSALGERLMDIVKRDSVFDPPKFLLQAETQFRTIVSAFAAGDSTTLKPLLTDPVFETFETAIAARQAAAHTQRTEIKAITAATIEDAQLVGDLAAVIVRFTSDQVSVTQDTTGQIVDGSESQHELIDLWTFERNLKSRDQNWHLAAARNG